MLITTILILVSMLFGLCGLPTVAGAAIEPDLQALMAATPARTQPIILHFSPDLENSVLPQGKDRRSERGAMIQTLRQRAAKVQQQAQSLLAQEGVAARELWLINALALEASPQLVARLAALPGVAEVRLDRQRRLPVRPAAEPDSRISLAAAAWNLEAIAAPALWARGLTGAGVVVASMDSGVDLAHPDLAPGWRRGSNSWFDPNGEHATPFDNDGHGTGTLGLIVARNSGLSVAPAATWIAVKIFDDAGIAFNSRIHQGFQWLLDPDGDPATDDAPDIVNNAWGFEDDAGLCDAPSREFQADVQALKAAGIAVVFAAGNTGPAEGSSVSPGNYPEAVAVGAVGRNPQGLQVLSFSARGPSACDGRIYPDLVAPGMDIQVPALNRAGAYQSVAGTSFASSHVAGVMALLLSDPGRAAPSPARLEAVLKRSATDLGAIGPDNAYGQGLVNALAADDALKPTQATLLAPGDGAVALETTVVFSWIPGVDGSGEPVSETLVIAVSPDFSGATSFPLSAAAPATSGVLLAGALGLVGFGWLGRRPGWALAVLVAMLLTVAACGGGGGSGGDRSGGGGSGVGGDPIVADGSVSLTLSDLQPGTSYFWKVQTRNSLGSLTESATRQFTTGL